MIPNKLLGGPVCKENASPNRSPKRSPKLFKKKVDKNAIDSGTDSKVDKCIAVNTQSSATNEGGVIRTNTLALTPRIAMLEEDTSNLLARLQKSYKISRDILKEIYKEKAEILDMSPLKNVSNSEEYKDISAYCEEKLFSITADNVEVDEYQEVASYCVDKVLLLSNASELDAMKNEKNELLLENNDLREQIQFKSACYIQAEASIATMIKIIKEKETAIEQYDQLMRLNDMSNAKVVTSIEMQHQQQIAVLNEKLQSSSNEIKELESKLDEMEKKWIEYKGMCKLKDRHLESAVETAANLERAEKEHADLKALVKEQSSRIDYLTNLNDGVNQVLSSLTHMIHEKEQAIDDWVNFSKMNEEASKKLFSHVGKKHQQELQERNNKIDGLLGIIQRQKFGESEYMQTQLKEKAKLQMEVNAMKLRLDSYDMDDQRLTDTHVILAVLTLSSGLLLLFWSYVGANIATRF